MFVVAYALAIFALLAPCRSVRVNDVGDDIFDEFLASDDTVDELADTSLNESEAKTEPAETVSQDVHESHVNDVEKFRQEFKSYFAKIQGQNTTLVGETKQVVFLIPTKAGDVQARDVPRQTWMQHENVCKASQGPKQGCVVYVTFITSTSDPTPLDCPVHNDCSQVNSPDNWLLLYKKTVASYRFAVETYPWATHIGKLDLDTFPYVHKIVPNIPKDKYSLIGKMLVDNKFTGWRYPQGGFTLLSRDLAAGAFADDTQTQVADILANVTKRYHRVSEDLNTGFLIHKFAELKKVRVTEATVDIASMWTHLAG